MVRTMGGKKADAEGSKEKKRKRVRVADDPPLPADDPARPAHLRKPAPTAPAPAPAPAPQPIPQQAPNPLTPAHQGFLARFIPRDAPPKEPVYSFDAGYKIMLSRDAEKWLKIKAAKVAKPLYPVHDDLRTMNIFDEVNSILTDGNLGFIMWDDPGTYHKLVLEFISTLEVIWVTKDKPESLRIAGSKRWAERWIFQINGYFHTLTEEEFEKIFNYQRKDTSFTNPSTDEDNEFWRYITESNITFISNSSSSLIRLPAWRIIHRLVAENLATRADRGSRVNHRDLEIMRTLRRGKGNGVRLMTIFSDLFERCLSCSVLGGGSVITLIAKHLGYNLSGGKMLEPNKLGLTMMKNAAMIDKDNNWIKETPNKKGKGNSDAQAVDGDVEARLKAIEECQIEIKGKQVEIDTKLDNIQTTLQTILQHITASHAPAAP